MAYWGIRLKPQERAWWRKVHTSPTAAEQGLVSGWRGIHILWISDDSYSGHSLQFVDSWVLCWKGLLLFFLHATAQKAVSITTTLLGWSYSHGTELFWVCWAFPKKAEVGVWGNWTTCCTKPAKSSGLVLPRKVQAGFRIPESRAG